MRRLVRSWNKQLLLNAGSGKYTARHAASQEQTKTQEKQVGAAESNGYGANHCMNLVQ